MHQRPIQIPTNPEQPGSAEPISAAPAGGMPPGHRRLAILLGALTALAPLGLDMYLPAFPAMGADLAASEPSIQRTLATFLLGMSVGQLIYGPLADRLGRRLPMIFGIVVFTLASIGCALATSAEALVWLRLAQALGGCVGVVIARAVVRDVSDERGAVRMMSMLMLAMGAAPILAPMLGGWLMAAFGWRAIFWFLALYGAVALLVMRAALPETLPPEQRRHDNPLEILRVYRDILVNRHFLAHALAGALPMAGMFAYLVGSPHVLMGVHGLGPQQYGLAFGANALGLIVATQVVARLVGRAEPAWLLPRALFLLSLAGLAVLAAVATGGLLPLLAAFFLYLVFMGSVLPLTSAMALAPLGQVAGSASAVMGTLQFGVGAVVGTALGALGGDTTLPMGVLIALAGCSGLAVHLWLRAPARARARGPG